MRKKTIGEVLRLARINQGLSLEELQEKTEIQLHFLEAMEQMILINFLVPSMLVLF